MFIYMKCSILTAFALYCFGSASKFINKYDTKVADAASGGQQSESWTARASKRSGPSGPRRFARKPGGRGVELTEKEVFTDAKARHSSCDFHVLDAKSPDFVEKLHRSSYKPLLILNAVENWNDEDWTKDSWLSILEKEGVMKNHVGTVYPWKMNSKDCCMPHFPDDVREYFSLWNQKNGTRADGTAEFAKDNGVIWDPYGFDEDGKQFPGTKYPVPEWFPKTRKRFLAFSAYGTSNGFHSHPTSQWLTQLRGYKSWYFFPPEIFTFPDDWTAFPGSDGGFYFEPVLQDADTVCGYKPQDPLLKRHVQSCTAGPGEIVLVPKRWWHSTCSLDEFMVATGGSLEPPHIDAPNQAYRTFPEEDRTEDNLVLLQKHFLSFPESRRPDKNIADKMARMLVSATNVQWQKIVFRIQVQRPNDVDKTAYFYNDCTHPLDLYARTKFGQQPEVHVATIGPNQVVPVETTTDWKFSADKMFSAKRSDGSGAREFSVLHGFGRDEHVLLGEKSVVSFQGSDELMEQLRAWHGK